MDKSTKIEIEILQLIILASHRIISTGEKGSKLMYLVPHFTQMLDEILKAVLVPRDVSATTQHVV